MSAGGHDSGVKDLLKRARGGDLPARDLLFTKCRNYVAVVARAQVESWLQAKVDSSDLVQQTLLEAHRGFAEFRGESEAEWLAWLRRILCHNANDFVRQYRGAAKRHAGREVPLQAPAGDSTYAYVREPQDSGESPSELIARHEQELQMAELIASLSADYQEVILLRNLQRLPFDEVARRMDRSRPAVQMLWMRALRALEAGMSRQMASH
jgi:RNA polymerase sigma-70 factor (ECF subfamily)